MFDFWTSVLFSFMLPTRDITCEVRYLSLARYCRSNYSMWGRLGSFPRFVLFIWTHGRTFHRSWGWLVWQTYDTHYKLVTEAMFAGRIRKSVAQRWLILYLTIVNYISVSNWLRERRRNVGRVILLLFSEELLMKLYVVHVNCLFEGICRTA